MKSKCYVNQLLCFAVFAAFFVLLQGCVAVQSFPTTARAGDTITLALGSVDGLNKSNLQISYTPQSTGIPVDLAANIRGVFKIYPDKTSTVWMDTLDSANILNVFSGHGAWLNVAVLNLPATLPAGPGYFQVNFGNDVAVPNVYAVQTAETVQIRSEILPAAAGLGAASSFDYYAAPGGFGSGDIARLAAIPHIVLRPQVNIYGYVSSFKPAAAEYRIKLPIIGGLQALDDSSVHVIWDDKPGEFNKQIQLNWHRQGDELTVNVLVPGSLTLQVDMHRFSIVVVDGQGLNVINVAGTPQLLSFRYFDLNGTELAPSFTPEVVVMK